MTGVLERIKDIEHEISRTQINKATNKHLCKLRARLCQLRAMLIEDKSSGGEKGAGFAVARSGNARVALIGYPSVGKSSMLSKLTKTESEAADYAFTTLTTISGVIEYNDAKIQLLDMPGIIDGAAKGVGRGKQVIAVARTADLIIMLLDGAQAARQRRRLTYELESMGIRLNQQPPNIYFRKKPGGGLKINSMVKLTHLDDGLIRSLLQMYRIHNCELLFREDSTADDFIDVLQGNRVYIRCLYVVNKVDTMTMYDIDRYARQPDYLVISVQMGLNLDFLLKKMWEYLALVRVYTKPRGTKPDFSDPMILRRGATIEEVCRGIHKSFIESFKYGLVWGLSAKHQPQRVGLSHQVEDEDVVQLMSNK